MGKKPKSSDIHSGPGFRVRTSIERPDQSLIDGLGEFETPDISDVLNRLYARPTGIWSKQALVRRAVSRWSCFIPARRCQTGGGRRSCS